MLLYSKGHVAAEDLLVRAIAILFHCIFTSWIHLMPVHNFADGHSYATTSKTCEYDGMQQQIVAWLIAFWLDATTTPWLTWFSRTSRPQLQNINLAIYTAGQGATFPPFIQLLVFQVSLPSGAVVFAKPALLEPWNLFRHGVCIVAMEPRRQVPKVSKRQLRKRWGILSWWDCQSCSERMLCKVPSFLKHFTMW